MMDPRHEPFSDEAEHGTLSDVLDDIARFLRRFVVFASRAQSDAVALWVAHTWVLDAADQTPYLHVRSAQKRSGKTLLLELLAMLTRRPWVTIGPSEAVLFRKIERDRPTLILDEIDSVFRNGARKDDNTEGLRGVLNAGCRRGATVPRCVPRGKEIDLVEFSVFCPKALGGIGQIPDTLADRSIRIELKRKRPADQVERFRPRLIEPQAEPIRRALEAWSESAVKLLTGAEPDLPDQLHDRAQDAWESLLTIADMAGGTWPSRARDAAIALTPSTVEDDDIAVQLLADCRSVFDTVGRDRIHSADLVMRLTGMEDRPWGDWRHGTSISARKVADMLGAFEVRPRMLRIGPDSRKGYRRADFEDAWSRYVPSPSSSPIQRSQVNSAGQSTCERSQALSHGSQVNSAGQTLFSAENVTDSQRSDQPSEPVNLESSRNGDRGTARTIEVVETGEADWQPCIRCGRPCPSLVDGKPQHVDSRCATATTDSDRQDGDTHRPVERDTDRQRDVQTGIEV